jgi:hypothetical protein
MVSITLLSLTGALGVVEFAVSETVRAMAAPGVDAGTFALEQV